MICFCYVLINIVSYIIWCLFCLGRKLSPTPPSNRLSIEAPNEKDEGISDEEDPAELRLLLELNEQVMTSNVRLNTETMYLCITNNDITIN